VKFRTPNFVMFQFLNNSKQTRANVFEPDGCTRAFTARVRFSGQSRRLVARCSCPICI
jgi:hypothetical protein